MTNLILTLTALLVSTILASCIVGAKVERFSKSYAISSGFINFGVITLIAYIGNSTNLLGVELWNSIYTCCNQSLITFLFCVLFIVIIPLGLGLFAASLSFMFLHIEIWVILAVNKCVLIPISDSVVLHSVLYSYLAVCCSILFNIKTNKSFSVGDIAIVFMRVLFIYFIMRLFIVGPMTELLSGLPALIIALDYNKAVITGAFYADSAGGTGAGSSSHNHLPGSSSNRNPNNNGIDIKPYADGTPSVDSMLVPNITGLSEPHWQRTVNKLEQAANAAHQHKVNQNAINGTPRRSTSVRLAAAMNQTNNPPFTPLTIAERGALKNYFVRIKGITLQGSGNMTVFTDADKTTVFQAMRRLI